MLAQGKAAHCSQMTHSGHLVNGFIVVFSRCKIWASIYVLHDNVGVISDCIGNFQLSSVNFIVWIDFLRPFMLENIVIALGSKKSIMDLDFVGYEVVYNLFRDMMYCTL